MKNYNEKDCIVALNKKQHCKINGKLIEVSKENGDVGKKSWAKIEYLCKVHGYRYIITNFAISFSKSKGKQKYNEEVDEKKIGKMNKKGNNASFMKQLKTMINL